MPCSCFFLRQETLPLFRLYTQVYKGVRLAEGNIGLNHNFIFLKYNNNLLHYIHYKIFGDNLKSNQKGTWMSLMVVPTFVDFMEVGMNFFVECCRRFCTVILYMYANVVAKLVLKRDSTHDIFFF